MSRAWLRDEAGVHGVARPDAGEAVRLQFDADRAALCALVLRAVEDAAEVLDVVAVLVGDHVGLGERPACKARADSSKKPRSM